MGQKINPTLFRSSQYNLNKSVWMVKDKNYSDLLLQDNELRLFLENILVSRGIFLRSCVIERSAFHISLKADLYFSHILAKEAKFFWAKSLFKTIQKKYFKLNRIRDIKNFVDSLETYDYLNEETLLNKNPPYQKDYFDNKSNKIDSFSLGKRNKFFFFLLRKQKKWVHAIKKDRHIFLSSTKKTLFIPWNVEKFIRLDFSKLTKLFSLNKLNYNFQKFSIKNSFESHSRKKPSILLNLNKNICKSLQNFLGVEEVFLEFSSKQLLYLPLFKLYKRALFKDLLNFQRNKELSKFFLESNEILYFSIVTFGYGNASLVAKLIIYLLEKNRKHLIIVKFLRKSLTSLLKLLPKHIHAIEGIKIQIKGRFNKRRRTKKIIIQEGQISLQTLDIPLDYSQQHAVTLYGSFGIKVWISRIHI